MNNNDTQDSVLVDLPIYQFEHADKQKQLLENLSQLTDYHCKNCSLYANFINAYKSNVPITNINDIPPFAVRHFKKHILSSINEEQVFKVLQSSGTSGQTSKIVLDSTTAKLQSSVLVKTLQHWLGKSRRPMLIIDTPATLTKSGEMTARAAGIRGFSLFGRDHYYALNEDLTLNTKSIEEFFSKYQQQPTLLFGFTYIVYQHFIKELNNKGIRANFSQADLFHGGGWKKMAKQAISNIDFKSLVKKCLGNVCVHDYYGMVEQTGSIHIECEHGYLHTPIWADIIIRNPADLSVEANGNLGLIQVNSIIAKSYPGHCLLTEDLGRIIGEDDCACGRKGKYFVVQGRVPKAESRGCSDTLV